MAASFHPIMLNTFIDEIRRMSPSKVNTRLFSNIPNCHLGGFGNWPLNTTERWMSIGMSRSEAQIRIDKLQKIQ